MLGVHDDLTQMVDYADATDVVSACKSASRKYVAIRRVSEFT